jgi:hypothetical protein
MRTSRQKVTQISNDGGSVAGVVDATLFSGEDFLTEPGHGPVTSSKIIFPLN